MSGRWAVVMLGVVLLVGQASARGVGTARATAFQGMTAGEAVISMSASFDHTCVLSGDGFVLCWGDNGSGQLGAGTTMGRHAPVEVPSFRFNINPAVELRRPGRVATVTTLVACPEDQQVQLTVLLTQGEAFGEGRAVEACTGRLERYPVTVPAPGPAEAEGVVRDHGAVVDIQTWTRKVVLELVPPSRP